MTALLRMAGLVALTSTVLLALSVGSASAAPTHVFKEAFGIPASDTPLALVANSGLAVNDETHDVYVADTGNHRIVEFSASGTFIRAFGADVGGAGVDVCTTGCVVGTSGTAPGQFEAPTFIAVDNAPGGAGDVYVADTADHLITKFEADGTLVAAWGNNGLAEAPNGQLVGQTQAEPFGPIAGIAVDSAGNLNVLRESPESVVHFLRAGAFLESFANPRGNAAAGLGVDSSGNFFKVNGNRTVEKFEPNGGEVSPGFGQVAPPGEPGNATGLAVDSSSGELLVDTGESIEAFTFSPSGEVTGTGCIPAVGVGCPPSGNFGAGHLSGGAGLAADGSNHDLYAASATGGQIVRFEAAILPNATTEAATALGVHEATLHGSISAAAGAPATCRFQYATKAAFESNGFQGAAATPCSPAGPFTGTTSEAVGATVTGLAAGTPYVFRLLGENEVGTNPGLPLGFETAGPQVVTESASEVSATAATLETELNPHAAATTYRFQYGTTAAYGSETTTGSAGSGTADVIRTAFVSGLAPGTTYHYRVLAESHCNEAAPLEVCVAEGPDATFTTQPAAGSSLLPDSRGWELVSPALKQGIPLEAISKEGGVIQAAADGSAITYIAKGAITPEPPGNRSALAESQDLSTRSPAGSWSTQDITTPHQQLASVMPGDLSEYKFFSPNLSLGAVEPAGATPLSPQAGEKTIYLRSADGSFEPLVNPSNVPFGTRFGGTEISPEYFEGGVVFTTATPDLSHVLLTSATSLVAGFENEGENAIFEWSGGVLTPVSFVPPEAATFCGGSGPECESNQGGNVGRGNIQMRNAISTDGSRVTFEVNSGGLYLRDLARNETLLLDTPQGGPGNAGAAVYQTASADGSRVFFTDAERLTAGSTAAQGKPDLYMCQITVEAGHLACALTDITENTLDRSEPAAVQGAVIGAAEDGSSVYFVANGALTTGASPGDCAGTQGVGTCNLYRYDTGTSSLRFVAGLSGADFNDWAASLGGVNLTGLTARVSPSGNWLAFMSARPLTGYDNRDAVSGERDEEVFLYEGGVGKLLCASCNPSGARPQGVFDNGIFPGLLVDRPLIWPDTTLAASIPGWTSSELVHALYQSRYLSNSGRLFFNAADALVPQDTNGAEDVYQYEPPGVGICSEASPSFAPRNGGCVDLVSSGTSAKESAFMDASESGNDVFFLTASRLTAKDEDGALDLYDARVDGGEAPPIKPVECSGDACQQPAVPPNDATPGSLTFNGAGNVTECPKGKVKQKGKCVKKHKAKKKHHKKHKKSKQADANRGGAK